MAVVVSNEVSVHLPAAVVQEIGEWALHLGVSTEDFIATAAREKMAAAKSFEFLCQEAARAKPGALKYYLAAAGNEEPVETDRILD